MDSSEIIRIERPPDEVFDAWARLERTPEWAASVVERRKLSAGPTRVGTRFVAIDRWPGPGPDPESIVEITAFDRPDRIAAISSDPLGGGWDAIFDPDGDGTRMTLHWSLSPSGLRGLAMPLLGPLIRRETRRSLAGFKAWVESGTARTRGRVIPDR